MNEKEIRELRRRFRADRNNISSVYACYVNEGKKIISMFEETLSGKSQEEADQYLNLLKKTLSGSLGKKLVELSFSVQQVMDSDEHRLLTMLRESALKDDNLLETFFQRIIENLNIEGSYLILLAHDVYSVPYRSSDDELQKDVCETEFAYVVCAICPVKLTQPELSYYSLENRFHAGSSLYVASTPELGFLFPAFDGRTANIYDMLYYSKNSSENHQEFIDGMFHTALPMPAATQKETFQNVLAEALDEECRFEVVQAVHEHVSELIDQHKQNKEAESLVLSTREIGAVLQGCGVSEQHIQDFAAQFDAQFGADAEILPTNVIDSKHFEITTPDVVIKVNPERSNLVETRVINGSKYILISTDGGVEVNGVNVQI
ncbi:MAG: DUF4317 domain-containing protein [Clostridia bacterium]